MYQSQQLQSVKCQTRLREILTMFPEIKASTFGGRGWGHLSNSSRLESTDIDQWWKGGKVWLTGRDLIERCYICGHALFIDCCPRIQPIWQQCFKLRVARVIFRGVNHNQMSRCNYSPPRPPHPHPKNLISGSVQAALVHHQSAGVCIVQPPPSI